MVLLNIVSYLGKFGSRTSYGVIYPLVISALGLMMGIKIIGIRLESHEDTKRQFYLPAIGIY